MLKYSLFGVILVAITVLIHAGGTTLWLRIVTRRMSKKTDAHRPEPTWLYLTSTVVVLTLLHTIQIMIWAVAFLTLLPDSDLRTFEEATYFSFVTFTSLGYGDITFSGVWRILSGIEALNGVLLLGWSTALLFAISQRAWKTMLRQGADDQDQVR